MAVGEGIEKIGGEEVALLQEKQEEGLIEENKRENQNAGYNENN